MASFVDLLETTKHSLHGLFNDDIIGHSVMQVLKEGFETKEEVLDDIEIYDESTIISDASDKIREKSENLTYVWNKSKDELILHQILHKIFKDNIIDITTLTNEFGSQIIPSSLIECTNTDILNVALIVTKQLKLHKATKKPVSISKLKECITEQHFNGEMLSKMEPTQFIDTIKPYNITHTKGKKLFNGIINYWTQNKKTQSNSISPTESAANTTEPTEAKQQETQNINVPQTLQQCTWKHLIMMLQNHIFHQTKPKWKIEQQTALISYITETQISGQQITDVTRKEFSANVVKDYGKLYNGAAGKLYTAIHSFTEFETLSNMATKPSVQKKRSSKKLSIKNPDDNRLSYDDIRRLARDLANKSLDKPHKRMQRAIKRNKIDGRTFVNKLNQSSYNKRDKTFKAFFDEKICAQKAGQDQEKYGKFREWFIADIDCMDDIKAMISKKDMIDFTKFVLDGYDEFISRIFKSKQLDSTAFIQRGYRSIATEIYKEYALPQGALTNLCRDIENHIKDEHMKKKNKYKRNRKNNSIIWTIRPTERVLPEISDRDSMLSPSTSLSILSETDNDTEMKQCITHMSECTVDHMVFILSRVLNDEKHKKLFNYKDAIISYFTEQKLDGASLLAMRKPLFASNVQKGCELPKKLTNSASKLYKTLKAFNVQNVTFLPSLNRNVSASGSSTLSSPEILQSQTSLIWNKDVTELKQCSADNIIYILNKHILPNAESDEKLQSVYVHKDTFISYFERNQIDGDYLCTVTRKTFVADVATFADNKKIGGPATKLLRALTDFDFNQIIQGAKHEEVEEKEHQKEDNEAIALEIPSNIEECSVEHIVHIIEIDDHILDNKLSPYKTQIVEYVKSNNLDGNTLISTTRKIFVKDTSQHLGDKKTSGSLGKMYNALINYNKSNDDEKEEKVQKEEQQEVKQEMNHEPVEFEIPSNLEQCSVEHIVHIIQNDDNLLGDKLIQYKTQIVEYIKSNKMNGSTLISTTRKSFVNDTSKNLGDTRTKGAVGKMYNALINYNKSNDEKEEKVMTEEKVLDYISCIDECNEDQISFIVSDHLLILNEFETLSELSGDITGFIIDNGYNGKRLRDTERDAFASALKIYLIGRLKTNEHAVKLYDAIMNFDVSQIPQLKTQTSINAKAANDSPTNPMMNNNGSASRTSSSSEILQSETSLIWNKDITELKQCDADHIIYVLNQCIFPKAESNPKHKQVIQNKDAFISFFKKEQKDGEYVSSVTRKQFPADVAAFVDNNNIKGAALKLLPLLKEFDLNQIIQGAKNEDDEPSALEIPSNLEECSVKHIVHIIQNDDNILDNKLSPYKTQLIEYVKSNNMDGSTLISTTRKPFMKNISQYLGDTKTSGSLGKMYKALINYNKSNDKIHEKTSTKEKVEQPTKIITKAQLMRNAKSKSYSTAATFGNGLDSIQEHKVASPKSPHIRSTSMTMIHINGIMNNSSKPSKHKRGLTLNLEAQNTKSEREQNMLLAGLDQDAFCTFVIKCVEHIPASKTVQTMTQEIKQQRLSGKKLVKHIKKASKSNSKPLEDFVQSALKCNEVFFLKYVSNKMISDFENNVFPFENCSADELAQYVLTQSYSLAADAFRKKEIDGHKYCSKNSYDLLKFLRKSCGFRAGAARPLMGKIDKYPQDPQDRLPLNNNSSADSMPSLNIDYAYSSGSNLGLKSSDSHASKQRYHGTSALAAGYRKGVKRNSSEFMSASRVIDDDRSDASETREMSISVSVNPHYGGILGADEAVTLFADHAKKIYYRENKRHWKRIKERLDKVGIERLLSHMSFDADDDEKGIQLNSYYRNRLDEKYFRKQAKLVYKIEVNPFYDELYKDVMNQALGFDNKMEKKEAIKWIVDYELIKLHSVIISEQLARKEFQNNMLQRDGMFCKVMMKFLPKKRRKVLWKKLKKDVQKNKLSHM